MDRRFGWILTSALVGMVACGDDSGGGGSCLVTPDCPSGQICSLGQCIPGIDAGPPPLVLPPEDDAGPGEADAGPPDCDHPATCEDLGAACGLVHDGCAFIECGDCTDPETCGGGGVPNQCGMGVCTASITCSSAGAECGYVDDGCNNMLDCGGCEPGETCGGDGTPNHCGGDGSICVPSTCQSLGANCGPVGDGCGGTLTCGSCPSSHTCSAGRCRCEADTCDSLDAQCGSALPDGCGGTLNCGTCRAPEMCNAGRCGCEAETCDSLNAECGSRVPDGCGGTLSCGTCTAPEKCGGAGKPHQCGCRNKRVLATTWKNATRAESTSSWRDGDRAFALDNRYATFTVRQDQCNNANQGQNNSVPPVTRTSNHLDLRGYDLKVPAGTKLTGIEARVLQSGGRIVEATVYTALGGSSNQGQGRVAGGFHYYGGPQNLFGLALNAGHTSSPTPWGLSMRVRVTHPGGPCPAADGTTTSRVDVIQLRAHYEVCD